MFTPEYRPSDIDAITFKSSVVGGFDKNEVMEFIRTVYADYEQMYKDNVSLKDKNNMLSEAVKEYKAMETALRDTVVSAHSISDEIKKNAHKEAELIIINANTKGEEMLNKANRDLDGINLKTANLRQEYNILKAKIKSVIQAQSELLDSVE
jgi:cell division initiation protein